MTDKRDIKHGFDLLAEEAEPNPTAWADIQVRIARSRWRRAILAATIAVVLSAGGFVVAGVLTRNSPVSPAAQAGWSSFRDPGRGWTVDYPESWYSQEITDRVFKYVAEGVLISNVDHKFEHPVIENGQTTVWDMRGLPQHLAVVFIRWTRTGLLSVGRSCAPQDTPLPLSIAKANRPTPSQDESFGAPTEVLDWHVTARQDNHYRVTAWLGAAAATEDRAILEQIVSSISFDDVATGGPVPGGAVPSPGDSFCE